VRFTAPCGSVDIVGWHPTRDVFCCLSAKKTTTPCS
jgi:hypothetical protein